jgi:predicted homoserine dehydrogenase-like protein
MIIVDRALEQRARDDRPVRVGMIGAGAMGRGIARQIIHSVPGLRLAAIANRHLARATAAFREAGNDDVVTADSAAAVESAVGERRSVVTTDALAVCAAPSIDVVLEVTGAVDFGARVVVEAIGHGKHVVTMNAELQGTVGPILKKIADQAGVVLTDSDGDQPGVIMNLYRFVKAVGCRPVLAGNIKGLHDRYRNPATQAGFAARTGLSPHMAASFADGSKVSFEMAIVANATGLRVAVRGMHGPDCIDVEDAAALFPLDRLLDGGIVDYVVGARPSPGVFVLGYQDDPVQQKFLKLYKRGDGPLYTFYTPYHLCHFEVPLTIARAALLGDATVAPLGAPVVDVVAAAKRDLRAGETVDGIGHFMTYGLCENADTVAAERLLPLGLAEGCQLRHDVPRDQVLTYADVELPKDRFVDSLRAQQTERFLTGGFRNTTVMASA